jgi:hypothetical protein
VISLHAKGSAPYTRFVTKKTSTGALYPHPRQPAERAAPNGGVRPLAAGHNGLCADAREYCVIIISVVFLWDFHDLSFGKRVGNGDLNATLAFFKENIVTG